ncbi:MAG: peptide chain release factor N(5)-glutamine methyltransferase [Ruminococcus sp.]|nr:peptide chain release factor N(5)-glutamine methyltransferase [Ruminococcus sp.]
MTIRQEKTKRTRTINMAQTYKQTYLWGVQELAQAQIAEAELEARLLLEYVCRTDRNTLLVHGEREVSAEEYESYVNHISERKKHVPLQYITGVQEFMGLEFAVNGHVLIPRQDTEILVEEVMRHLHDGMRLLDMCTGSGCILLSLLYYSNGCSGVGVDISAEALAVAKENAKRVMKLKNDAFLPEFIQSDLFAELDEKSRSFEIIVSNPPYIKSDVICTLMPEVKDFEPHMALDGKEDGLFFYRQIISGAGNYLAGGGMLFFEIGYDQGEDVKNLMENARYREVEIVKDYAGLDRVVYGSWR